MILSCNSCEKKFAVPDNAITSSGRLVQCSSCGNKWKQFPIKEQIKVEKKTPTIQPVEKKTSVIKPVRKKKINKTGIKKKKVKKNTKPGLYSPEYLAKKHGIKINETSESEQNIKKDEKKINFGFYSYLLVFSIVLISFLRVLYFAQDVIIYNFPFAEKYIELLFETITNIKEIIKDLFYY
jgi:predicted Zn finger-like uncharacterized protein